MAAVNEALCMELLKEVYDPELGVNIVDLALVRGVELQVPKAVVTMTLTSPACPAGPQIVQQVQGRLKSLKEIEDVYVNIVWDPPWSPDQISEEAKDELGMF